jgi:hypothetical protein
MPKVIPGRKRRTAFNDSADQKRIQGLFSSWQLLGPGRLGRGTRLTGFSPMSGIGRSRQEIQHGKIRLRNG